jgi:hypothetical protein
MSLSGDIQQAANKLTDTWMHIHEEAAEDGAEYESNIYAKTKVHTMAEELDNLAAILRTAGL